MSIHASCSEDFEMIFAARLLALAFSIRRLRRNAAVVWRRPRDFTVQWFVGIGAIVVATILFLASALSLGIMLNHLRSQMQTVERTQSVLLQTRGIENDLEGATRHYLLNSDPRDAAMVRIEARNAARRLKSLIVIAPGEADTLKSIARRIEGQIEALISGRNDDSASRALAAFRAKENAVYEKYRASTDRNIVFFIAFALAIALVGPALGLAGVTLLQHDRGRRHARTMQSELMHVQRLAVMGETAAMLAHEVSHPLAAASNYLAALRRSSANGDLTKTAEFIDRAAQQIHRAATILHRLRRFIEKRDAERAPAAPAVLIQDAVALLGPLDSDITLVAVADPNLPDVAADRIQVQQVLVNLIRNALEAMQDCEVRRLTIAAAAADGQVEFSLTDTGRGLPADVSAKLFQPFVSTKKDGMGVGLSICRSIITDHHGAIWAEPNPHGGTVFRFRLPVA